MQLNCNETQCSQKFYRMIKKKTSFRESPDINYNIAKLYRKLDTYIVCDHIFYF